MKIVGGSFGLSGRAKFIGQMIEISGDKKKAYKTFDIQSVSVRSESERKFAVFSAVIGMVVFGLIGMIFGPIGALIGVVLAIIASFYTVKRQFAEVQFSDGATVSLKVDKSEAKKLVKITNN